MMFMNSYASFINCFLLGGGAADLLDFCLINRHASKQASKHGNEKKQFPGWIHLPTSDNPIEVQQTHIHGNLTFGTRPGRQQGVLVCHASPIAYACQTIESNSKTLEMNCPMLGMISKGCEQMPEAGTRALEAHHTITALSIF